MWHLLKKDSEECEKFQDLLERTATFGPQTGLEEMLREMPSTQREHVAVCDRCRRTREDYFETRTIFQGVDSRANAGGPWFAARVMQAIAARQRELASSPSVWSVVPRFASRLAWVTAVVLLAGTTWLYERAAPQAQQTQNGGTSSQEYLFEAPQPPLNQDDVLISMAEKNP